MIRLKAIHPRMSGPFSAYSTRRPRGLRVFTGMGLKGTQESPRWLKAAAPGLTKLPNQKGLRSSVVVIVGDNAG